MAIENPAVELRFYRPGEDEPYVTLTNEVVESVTIRRRAEVGRDTASLRLDDRDGILSEPADRLVSGHRVDFFAASTGPGFGNDFGNDFGTGLERRYTGIIREPRTDIVSPDGQAEITLSPTDFVFTILSFRRLRATFEDRAVDEIIETAINTEAPEVGTGRIADFSSAKTDVFADGRRLDDLIRRHINAENAYVSSDATDLIIEQPGTLPSPTAISGDEHGLVSLRQPDDNVQNRIRVDGGRDSALDEQQTTVSAFETVDATTQKTTILNTTKSELSRIQIATDKDPDGGQLRVRLQKAAGGAPVAPDDPVADAASKTLAPDFLATDGDFTTFLMPGHKLPQTNIALIVEASGGSQPVGVDGNGNLAFKSEYPFPVNVREKSATSISEHRRRDARIRRENLDSTTAAQNIAEAELRGSTSPRLEVSLEAQQQPVLEFDPLDTIELTALSVPEVARNRELVVIERREEYENNRLQVDLTARATDQY